MIYCIYKGYNIHMYIQWDMMQQLTRFMLDSVNQKNNVDFTSEHDLNELYHL